MQLPTNTGVLSISLIDRSTSMRQFGPDLQKAFGQHLADLKASPEADRIALGAWTFAGRGPSLAIPVGKLAGITGLPSLAFDGGTPLYTSVAEVLGKLLDLPVRGQPRVVLNVLTDGDDRGSHFHDLGNVRRILAPQALARGFSLSVIGFGPKVDGIQIARTMGFCADISINVAGTQDGLHKAFAQMTLTTLPPTGKTN